MLFSCLRKVASGAGGVVTLQLLFSAAVPFVFLGVQVAARKALKPETPSHGFGVRRRGDGSSSSLPLVALINERQIGCVWQAVAPVLLGCVEGGGCPLGKWPWAQAAPSSLLLCSVCVSSYVYKDSNMLHLPTERFSPVRRFSDGAASIQAFKAQLEKMGNHSSIKQLQQVQG